MDYTKSEPSLLSSNQKTQLHLVVWEPSGGIRAILQISHGMVEYVHRYDEFARYLTRFGILVIGNDHLGHGSATADEELGYFGPGLSGTVVDDLHLVTRYAKETYGESIPYFLFGHSMGSFMARRYMMTYGNEIDGCILSGTGAQPDSALKAGKLLAGAMEKLFGDHYRSKLLTQMAMGAYNKRIPHPETKSDWISKDKEIVRKYVADKYCTFTFTVNGYQTLFDSLIYIQDPEHMSRIPKKLPVLLISGGEDPVGNYGRDVENIYKQYKELGLHDIHMKLYPGDRHELHNETDRLNVYQEVKDWLLMHI